MTSSDLIHRPCPGVSGHRARAPWPETGSVSCPPSVGQSQSGSRLRQPHTAACWAALAGLRSPTAQTHSTTLSTQQNIVSVHTIILSSLITKAVRQDSDSPGQEDDGVDYRVTCKFRTPTPHSSITVSGSDVVKTYNVTKRARQR